MFRRKRCQGLNGIVADGKQRYASCFEVPHNPLQLDELRFAKGSPASTAIESNEGPVPLAGRVEINDRVRLIGQNDVGEPLSNLGSLLTQVFCHNGPPSRA